MRDANARGAAVLLLAGSLSGCAAASEASAARDRVGTAGMLLLHGDADDLVPVTLPEDFATALRTAGNEVELGAIPAGTHDTVYSAESAAAEVTRWIRGR